MRPADPSADADGTDPQPKSERFFKLNPTEVTLSLVLEQPTAGVDFGLQSGHGNDYEILQRQRSTGKDLKFEFTVSVKPSKNGTQPNFGGPFVQGPAGEKFFYINIGTYAGQIGTVWSRRLKVPLHLITWDMIKNGGVLSAHIPGTSKDGSPSCAYEWRKRVDPSWNWKVEE